MPSIPPPPLLRPATMINGNAPTISNSHFFHNYDIQIPPEDMNSVRGRTLSDKMRTVFLDDHGTGMEDIAEQ